MFHTLLLLSLLQSAAEAEEDPALLAPVQVTAGRVETSVFDATQAVSVVDREHIERAAPLVIADVMRGIPGVFVQQTTPGQGLPIIRGLKGSENLHLVDGFRLNNAFFRNAPNQYLALVAPSNLEQVEVLRGPGSVLYGSDAMGGVVQLLTRQPEFATAGDYRRYSARVQLASASDSVTTSAALEGGDRSTAWRLHAAYQDVGDRRTGSGRTLEQTGYEGRSLNAALRRSLSEGSELRVQLQYLRQPSTPRVDELIAGFGQDRPDSAEFFFEPNERTFLQTVLVGENRWGADHYEFHLGYQQIRDDRRTRATGSRERRLEENTSDLWGLTAQFDRQFGSIALVWGAELYHDRVESSRRALDLDSGERESLQARFPGGSTLDSLAAYLNAEWRLSAGNSLTLGGRYSRFDIDLAEADRGFGARLEPDDVTFNLGWRHQLGERTVFSANLGEGFRAPNVFDLGTLGPRPGNRFNVSNPALKPESVRSVDAGFKWQGLDVQAELFGFYSRFEDKITSVPTGERTADGRQIVRSENVAEVDLYGLEFGGRWYATAELEGHAALNWTRGEETDAAGSSQPADRVPPLSGRLGVIWHARSNLSIDLWSDFARRQDRLSDRDRRDPRINPEGTAGWLTVNVRADWELSSRWRLGVGVDNLFDRAYREHASGLDAPGVNAKVTVSANW